MKEKMKNIQFQDIPQPYKDILATAILLSADVIISAFLFCFVSKSPINIALFFIIGVITIARYTHGYFYGLFASVFGVVFINCFFTYPYFQIDFTLPDYPFTFICMLTLSFVTSSTTTTLKQQKEFLELHKEQLLEAEREKMQAKFLRSISHDLRTPLTGIIGSITSIESEGSKYSPEDCQNLIHNIHADAIWLLRMVENILSVTKIKEDGSKLAKKPEIVEEVVSEAVTRLKSKIPDADVLVEVPDEILMVPMDAMMIEQVLINLLENAIVHSKSPKPVQLIVEDQGQNISFRIIDQGKGLGKRQMEHLFDGTYSKSPSVDGEKGIGIGLSICHAIIIAHNGTISARNNAKGAEFLITLPKEGTYA